MDPRAYVEFLLLYVLAPSRHQYGDDVASAVTSFVHPTMHCGWMRELIGSWMCGRMSQQRN